MKHSAKQLTVMKARTKFRTKQSSRTNLTTLINQNVKEMTKKEKRINDLPQTMTRQNLWCQLLTKPGTSKPRTQMTKKKKKVIWAKKMKSTKRTPFTTQSKKKRKHSKAPPMKPNSPRVKTKGVMPKEPALIHIDKRKESKRETRYKIQNEALQRLFRPTPPDHFTARDDREEQESSSTEPSPPVVLIHEWEGHARRHSKSTPKNGKCGMKQFNTKPPQLTVTVDATFVPNPSRPRQSTTIA